jgi:ubiquinone/menaquinone biosynthesis C-methylase UbiE
MPGGDVDKTDPQSAIIKHYESVSEARRLLEGSSQLESLRTQELLTRYLPPPPAVVLDVGGGPGAYACWLARRGYEVHLIDLVPSHVEQARRASEAQPEHPLASATVGDARQLARADGSADAVLLFGPLYHLTDRADRVQALREARRVSRPGGIVLGAAICRFASILDGLVEGHLDDPEFARIVEQDLRDGQHRNTTRNPTYFTTGFFHHPDELRDEITEAGLQHELTLPIEGPGWLLQNFDDHWNHAERRDRLLGAIRSLEREPSVLGVSAHLLAVARNRL